MQAVWPAAISRPQCLEEKEVFELQCQALRKDSKMYKDRIEAILQQLEEVAMERDQVGAPRRAGTEGCSLLRVGRLGNGSAVGGGWSLSE